MGKLIKAILFLILGVIGLVVLAGVLVPILFKEDIQKAADKAISQSIDAEVKYDIAALELSVFSNFPDVTVGLGEIAVIGINEFEGDTLAGFKSLKITLDIMSVISGDQMSINGVYLDGLVANAIVNEDGKANWDIAKSTGEEEEEVVEEESAPFSLAVDVIEITRAKVVYDDRQGGTYAEIVNLNHNSSIELGEVYDITSLTSIEELTAVAGGVSYLKKDEFEAKIDALLDLNNMKFTFKENNVRLNKFALGFDGYAALPDDEKVEMDISFEAKETEFKNILSLIPAMYMQDFDALKTEGSLAFDGFAKGTLVDEEIPTFEFNLQVIDGFFQYPDLPESLHDVNIDFTAANGDGNLDNTTVDLKKFHMELGKNPIDMNAFVKNLVNYDMEANVKAQLNLADISKIYPIEGLDLKGTFTADVDAKGYYDEASERLPVVHADLGLSNGYVLSSEFPKPIEDINFKTNIKSEGSVNNTTVDVSTFTLSLDEEQFASQAHLKEFDDLNYSFDFNGVLNLDKLLKIYPLEGMKMGGKISIDEFHTEGKMSDVDAENYQALVTNGKVGVSKFHFTSEDLPQGFKLDVAATSFDPKRMDIQKFDGSVGRSDIHINGFVENYMGYLFSKTDTVLKGQMNFSSNKFDANEWMSDEEEVVAEETTEEVPMEVVPVPGNIDFVLSSRIGKVLYDNMEIDDFKGNIIVRDQKVVMEGVAFNTLDAGFTMDGEYNTQNIVVPTFAYDMTIVNLSIKRSYETFAMIQEFAPIAKDMEGNVDMDLTIVGPMDQEMMPVYDKMSGKGLLRLKDAEIKSSKTFSKIGKVLKKDISDISLNDKEIKFTIEDGKVNTEPFEANAGDINMILSGNSTITGALDYIGEVTVPGGALTSTANSLFKDYGVDVGDNIILDLSILGDFAEPKVKVVGTRSENGSSKEVVGHNMEKMRAEAEKRLADERKKREAEARARVAAERKKAEAEARKKADEQKARLDAERKKKEAEARRKAEAEKKKLQNKAKDELKKFKF